MKIAVIGLGSIGRRHRENFRALGCDVLCYDTQIWAVGCSATPLKDVLEHCQGAVIATPPESHVELAWKALGAGCHLMIEKPVSTDLTDLGHLFAACERAGKAHMVAYPWRYDRSMNLARARVTELGPPTSWSCHYSYRGGNLTSQRMGPLLDCSHALDFLRWMLGEPKPSPAARRASALRWRPISGMPRAKPSCPSSAT